MVKMGAIQKPTGVQICIGFVPLGYIFEIPTPVGLGLVAEWQTRRT